MKIKELETMMIMGFAALGLCLAFCWFLVMFHEHDNDCNIPSEDMIITKNTTFCKGIYHINDPEKDNDIIEVGDCVIETTSYRDLFGEGSSARGRVYKIEGELLHYYPFNDANDKEFIDIDWIMEIDCKILPYIN
jgi:hypothetical protein